MVYLSCCHFLAQPARTHINATLSHRGVYLIARFTHYSLRRGDRSRRLCGAPTAAGYAARARARWRMVRTARRGGATALRHSSGRGRALPRDTGALAQLFLLTNPLM